MTQALLAVVVSAESEEEAVDVAKTVIDRTLVGVGDTTDLFPPEVTGGFGFYAVDPPLNLPDDPAERQERLVTLLEKPWRREEYSEWRAHPLTEKTGQEYLREQFKMGGNVYVFDASNGPEEPPTPVTTEAGIEAILDHTDDYEFVVPVDAKY